MSLDDHVSLSIIADSVSASRQGFGGIGIVSHNCDFEEVSRTYADASEAAEDWETDSPEYLAIAQIFGQSPRPPSVKVLNAKLAKPTQRYACAVAAVKNSHKYQMVVSGEGFEAETVEVTSDSNATNDEIVAALVAALNDVSDNNYLAAVVPGASDTDTFTVTADNPGDWFSLSIVNPDDLDIAQNHADADIDTDLAAIKLLDDDWFWMLTLYNSEAYVLTAAAWAQANGKMYYFASNATADLETSTGTSGVGDKVRALAYKYAAGDYHPTPSQFADAAVVGGLAARKIGSWTAKFKRRSGVTAVALTPTRRANLVARQMNFYETTKGLNLTSEGTTFGDGVYKWIDNVVNIDWLKDVIATNVFSLQNSEAKIPFTDAGIALVEAQVRAGLSEAVDNTVIVEDFEVTVPKMEDVSSSDRALRILPDVEFDAVLQGAIHKVKITGRVSP